jgi:hypothetical protein
MHPGEPRRTSVQPVKIGDVQFFVELAEAGGPRTVGLGDLLSFDGVRETIEAIGGELTRAWETVKPTEATVEFGLSLTAKSGKLSGLVVEGAAGASLKVTMVWKHTDEA